MKQTTSRTLMALAMIAIVAMTGTAHDAERPDATTGMLYAPLVYDQYDMDALNRHPSSSATTDVYNLDAGDQWLQEAIARSSRTRQIRQRAMIENPQSAKPFATSTSSDLSRSLTDISTVPSSGSAVCVASSALKNASPKSLAMPSTSPVDLISGPRSGSTSWNILNGNTASLTPQ